jgi:SulP family sulfate permease
MPILDWGKTYSLPHFFQDMSAAVIVTIMLIPQSLAYALLAGLPPEIGLYASMMPLVAYMIFGSSNTLAVGPVAVISLMTASAIGKLTLTGEVDYLSAAVMLALLSGIMLLILGIFRLGFLANFLSHPVISGFIIAAGLLIATSQFGHILGIAASGQTLPILLMSLFGGINDVNSVALIIGVTSLIFLVYVRIGLKPLLEACGLSSGLAANISRAGPLLAVSMSISAVQFLSLGDKVAIVGSIPQGLPSFSLPDISLDMIEALWLPAFFISIIGFVESVSVGQTLAARKNERIDSNQELIGLGAANIAASVSGGYPVTGGFARSVVNFDAGAVTPAAGGFTAVGIGIATLVFTPYLYFLPKAVLAATIIIAVLSLIDLSVLKNSWFYSKSDFFAIFGTIIVTLFMGVEFGVSFGVTASIALYLYQTSQPHIAEIGLVPETQHFRNILRHNVITSPLILSLRVDENLYFANAELIDKMIKERLEKSTDIRHVVLNCTSISLIDASALEVLEKLNKFLISRSIGLHFSELKGPVEDRLLKAKFFEHLSGQVFLHHYGAVSQLDPKTYVNPSVLAEADQSAHDGSHI